MRQQDLSDAIGLRGECDLPLCACEEFYLSHHPECPARRAFELRQARIEALEEMLDPETLARKIGDWDFTHNDDYFCFKFGGDGDNGEMLIEALAALLKETAQ